MEIEKDYLVEIKVKNNLLLRKMHERGIYTVSDLSKQTNIPPSVLGRILSLKEHVFLKNISGSGVKGDIRKPFLTLCGFFNCGLDDIYPKVHQYAPLKNNKAEREVSFEQIESIISIEEKSPELLGYIEESMGAILNKREIEVLKRRFGFEGGEETFSEIAEDLNLSHTRIRQIEKVALRKLRRPSVSQKIKQYH